MRALSMRARAAPPGLYVFFNQAPLVLDVMHELVAKVLEEALHRQRRRVAQGADRAARDVVGDVVEERQVVHAALAVLDAVDDSIEPARAFAARRALPARLL